MSVAQRARSIFGRIHPRARLALKCALLFALALWASYSMMLEGQAEDVAMLEAKEEQLRQVFLEKKRVAIELPTYQSQLEDLERQFGTLVRSLPAGYQGAHERVMRAATLHGLRIDQMNVADGEQLFDFYAQVAAKFKLTGTFHDFGSLLNDVAGLAAFVVVQDFQIQSAVAPGTVSMDASVSAFRYLDGEEIAAQRKKAAAARKGAKK